MSEEKPKKAPKSPKNLRNAHHHPETKHRAYLGLGGSNPNWNGHLVHPQAPTANNLTQQVVQKHVDNAPWFAHHEHRRMELGDEGFQTYD